MSVGQRQPKSRRNYPEEMWQWNPPLCCASTTVHKCLELRKATLESHGYCVKIASSGYTAMKMLEETSVAAVLLEYKLEGMDAEAVACHIKQRFPNLPIILLSAYSEMPERILWLVDEYVMKSELPERLVPIIERLTTTWSSSFGRSLIVTTCSKVNRHRPDAVVT
jgi:CheY-like chemotaxis protein